jgi:hypothetical protein
MYVSFVKVWITWDVEPPVGAAVRARAPPDRAKQPAAMQLLSGEFHD